MYSDKGWSSWSEWSDIQGETYISNGYSGNGIIKFAKTEKGWSVVENGGWGAFVWPPPEGWQELAAGKPPKAALRTSEADSYPKVWIFPDSSTQLLTEADLAKLDKESLWRARNEIYARKGLIFSTPRGKELANSLGAAYKGTETSQMKISSMLNETEKANIRLIRSFED